MSEETKNQVEIIVRREYYDNLLAELAGLRNLQTRIKNAFEGIDMPIHISSLGAAVEETILRLETCQQERHDIRVERDAMMTKVYLYAQERDKANETARQIAAERDALRQQMREISALLSERHGDDGIYEMPEDEYDDDSEVITIKRLFSLVERADPNWQSAKNTLARMPIVPPDEREEP